MRDVIEEAFQKTGAAEHGDPQIFWDGTTIAPFRKEVVVEQLDNLTDMNRVDTWRSAQRFIVRGASGHKNPVAVLVYNTYQPASDNRVFKPYMRIAFCKAVIKDSVQLAPEIQDFIGFALCGDANCSQVQWGTAFDELAREQGACRRAYPSGLSFVHGIHKRNGDLVVGAGKRVRWLVNECKVIGREPKQHDPMYMLLKWEQVMERRWVEVNEEVDEETRTPVVLQSTVSEGSGDEDGDDTDTGASERDGHRDEDDEEDDEGVDKEPARAIRNSDSDDDRGDDGPLGASEHEDDIGDIGLRFVISTGMLKALYMDRETFTLARADEKIRKRDKEDIRIVEETLRLSLIHI